MELDMNQKDYCNFIEDIVSDFNEGIIANILTPDFYLDQIPIDMCQVNFKEKVEKKFFKMIDKEDYFMKKIYFVD